MKSGRIFSEKDRLQLSKSRNELRDSEYASHIGGINAFFSAGSSLDKKMGLTR